MKVKKAEQEVSSQAADTANNELYGFYKEFPQKIEAVTADDVPRVAKTLTPM